MAVERHCKTCGWNAPIGDDGRVQPHTKWTGDPCPGDPMVEEVGADGADHATG